MERILELRDRALKALSNKLDSFYLAGGTALSLFYFKHRESFDLDFFTGQFSQKRIQDTVAYLSDAMKTKIDFRPFAINF